MPGFFRKRPPRTPTILQMEAVECGAAALAIIMAHFGYWVPLETLRLTCGVSRDGSKASNLVKAARRYGFDVVAKRAEVAYVQSLQAPAIVFWSFNHFLVVEGFAGDTVYLNDPAVGPRTVSLKEFDDNFTGVVLELTPGDNFQPGGQPRSLLQSLMVRLRGSKNVVGLIGLFAAFIVLPGLALPGLQRAFVDDILGRGYVDWFLQVLAGLALTAIFIAVLNAMQQRFLVLLQNKLSLQAGAQFFWHALRLPVSFYAQRYVGDVISRLSGLARVSELLSGHLATNLANGAMIVFYFGVMLSISWRLSLGVLLLTSVNAIAVAAVQRKRMDKSLSMAAQSARATATGLAGIQAIESLKATGTEGDFFRTWAGHHANQVNSQQELSEYSRYLDTAPALIRKLTEALILLFGALLVIDGRMTIGSLVAYQTLAGLFFSPVEQLVAFSGKLQEIKADISRIEDLEKYPLDQTWGDGQLLLEEAEKEFSWDDTAPGLDVELRGLSFAYSPLEPPFIEDLHLNIAPGRWTAVVGGSGSGKSTLAKLVMGFYPTDAGVVLFQGRRITEIPRELFASEVGYVEQETGLFSGTVRDNITLWDEAIADEAVIAAARDAAIHDVIASRAGGYRSFIDERGNLSGGQKQRLNIARALVRNPRFLVLDEATAALDAVTEAQIYRRIRQRGCSCLVIAHRLSAVRDADEIIVMDSGKVVERGTHTELLAARGHYHALVGEEAAA